MLSLMKKECERGRQDYLNWTRMVATLLGPVSLWSTLHVQDSPIVATACLVFSFTALIGCSILQWQYQRPIPSSVFPLTLIIDHDDTEADRELFKKLHHLFKANFPNGKYVEYDGYQRNKVQLRFNFKSADADVIIESIQPLLKDISLPVNSHYLALVGPDETRELSLSVKF